MVDYSINAVPRRVVYSGSAGVGPYAFTFEVLAPTDIAVYKNATQLTLTTHYTVTINANGTGSVTLVTAATSSDRIVITGARAIQRTTDFATAGDLVAASLNEQFDANVIFSQQIAETAKRSLTAPVHDPEHVDSGGTLNMMLPSSTDRALKLLGFDSVGNPTTYLTGAANGEDAGDITFIQSGSGAVGRTVEDKLYEFVSLLDFIPTNLHAGIKNRTGTTPLTTYIQNAINAGKPVYAPKGTYVINGNLELAGASFHGAGIDQTIFKKSSGTDQYDMMRVTGGSGHSLRGFTLDGVLSTDTLSGAGLYLLSGATNGLVADISVKNMNTQGFATNSVTYNKFINLRAEGCGHRGFNMSVNSNDNIVDNFHAKSCKKAGFLIGFASHRNVITNLRLYDSIDGEFWLHHGCEYNVVSNVIAGEANASAPSERPVFRCEIGCKHNHFSNVTLIGARNRGLGVSNGPYQETAGGLTKDDGSPCEFNSFHNFKIFGVLPLNGTSTGVFLQNSAENFGTRDNEFRNFYISGFDKGVSYGNSLILRSEFENVKFGTTTTARWSGISWTANLASRFINCRGLNDAGFLTGTTTDFGAGVGTSAAQPDYVEDEAILNPFGVPVMVTIRSTTTALSTVTITGGTVGGNMYLPNTLGGDFLVRAGESIKVTGGASVVWRWRTAGS